MTAARLLAITALTLAGCAPRTAVPASPATPPGGTLQATLDSIVLAPPLHRTHWGIHIVDAASGRTLYTHNAERLFITASNMKLVTGAVALGRLGQDYSYRTPLLALGRSGDSAAALLVVGSGDPTWSQRFHPDATAPFDSLAARAARAGVRAAGELVIDASRFTDEAVHGAWEVGDLPWSYAPPVAAFGAADGTFRLVVTGAATPGAPADARVIGPVPQPIRAHIVTDTAGARAVLRVDYTARRDTVYLTGSVAAGAADTSVLAVTRPAESAGVMLADALRRAGVHVGSVRVLADTAEAARAQAGAVPLAEYVSSPMHEIVAAILRPSQNWIAEQVLKTLGAEHGAAGSWRAGTNVARQYLYDVVRVDSGSINLRDASGLSAQNLLTPAAVVELLRFAQEQPWAGAFRDAMAAPGLAGSTLSGRLRGLEGRVHAKTGTISNVNALSGYLVTDDGRQLVFSIMTNASGLPAARVRAAMDQVVRAAAAHADAGSRRTP